MANHTVDYRSDKLTNSSAFSGFMAGSDRLIPVTLNSYQQFMISQATPMPVNLRRDHCEMSGVPAMILRHTYAANTSPTLQSHANRPFLQRDTSTFPNNTRFNPHNCQRAWPTVDRQLSRDRQAVGNFEDTPIDLSKPKSQQTKSHQPAVSQLARLLSKPRKRKLSRVVTDCPLNLTKKPSLLINEDRNWIMDMTKAVDNPVQLIQLAESSVEPTTQKISELLMQVSSNVTY